jgi:hypothetical protein
MSKIPVYFMPGLAASTAILKEYFQKLILKCIFRMGDSRADESLAEYAKRKLENPVL